MPPVDSVTSVPEVASESSVLPSEVVVLLVVTPLEVLDWLEDALLELELDDCWLEEDDCFEVELQVFLSPETNTVEETVLSCLLV